MRVSDALEVSTVMLRPSWASFEAAVEGLVGQLVATGRLRDGLGAEAVARIIEREAQASTAMVDIGVSIPHARLDGIDGLVFAIALSPDSVYDVADGLPISIVALVLSSPALTGEHLNFLSALSMLLQSAAVRTQLRNVASAQEVLSLVHRHEQFNW